MRRRDGLALYLLALAWHLLWAARTPGPFDWDPSYYLGVAQAIAAGRGAVTDAVWNLAYLPPALVHPADLHWMPLPSRVLVPAVGLAGALGATPWAAAQAMTAALGAAQAVLAAWWTQRLAPGRRDLAWLAGLVAGSGLGYVRFFAVPDSMAVYGLVAGGAFAAAAGAGAPVTAALCAAAALCRAEGALVGLCVSVGLRAQGRRAWPGLVGPLAAAAWSARNQAVAGAGYLALRARAFDAVRAEDWLTVQAPPPLGVSARLALLAEHAGDLVRTPFAAGAVLLPLALLVAASPRRPRAELVAPLAYAGIAPVVLYLGAPSVAVEGSVFRSGAALLAVAVAVAVAGLSARSPRLHPAFLPAVYAGLQLSLVVAVARAPGRFSAPFPDCAVLDAAGVPAGAPLLSYDPLGTSTRCGHPGVILGAASPPAALDALADRYGIDWVLTAPAEYRSWTWRDDQFDAPGWTRAGPRVFTRRRDR